MFVATKKLQSLKDGTKDAVEYARKVMFRLLIFQDEIVSLAKVKTPGVGFVKLFESKNWTDFYGELKLGCSISLLTFPVLAIPLRSTKFGATASLIGALMHRSASYIYALYCQLIFHPVIYLLLSL